MIATTAIQPRASAASDSTRRSSRRHAAPTPTAARTSVGTITASAARRTTSRRGHAGVRGAALGGLRGGRARVQRIAGSGPVEAEPQRGRQDDRHDRQHTQSRLAQPDVHAVGGEQDPRLGPDQAGDGDEHECVVAPAVQVAVERAERERDQRRLGRAQQRGAVQVGAQREAQNRDGAREAAGQPGAEPIGQQQRGDRARAHRRHPHVRRGAAEHRQRREDEHGERLERRAGGGGEVQMRELAPPDGPRPGVVAERRGDEQRRGARERDGRHRHAARRAAWGLNLGEAHRRGTLAPRLGAPCGDPRQPS